MKAYKIKENIYWVGAIDYSLREFHGYSTECGTTYNAYLIIDEKITLVDTVKAPFYEEMLSRIKSVIEPEKIDIIISNHSEADHSGAIPAMLKVCPKAKLYASTPNGVKNLKLLYGDNMDILPVKTNDEIKTGRLTLKAIQTPMVHWPDNMVLYCPEEKLLFSNDAFGQHYGSSERLDTECSIEKIIYEAIKYYANIVYPYGSPAKRAIDSLNGVAIDMIAPSHGIIWTKHIPDILSTYLSLINNDCKREAVIVYDTMWHTTEKMALTIADTLNCKGVKTHLFNLKIDDISNAVAKIITSEYLFVGSPTINNYILPSMGGFLTYLKGLQPKHKKFMTFASYGWSGQSGQVMHEALAAFEGFAPISEPYRIQYTATDEKLAELAEKINQLIK